MVNLKSVRMHIVAFASPSATIMYLKALVYISYAIHVFCPATISLSVNLFLLRFSRLGCQASIMEIFSTLRDFFRFSFSNGGWTKERLNKRVDRMSDSRTNVKVWTRRTDERSDEWIDGQTDRWMDGQMDKQMDQWMVGRMDRWTDGWTDERMDGPMDGLTETASCRVYL